MPTAKKLPSGTWRVRVYVGKKEGKTITQFFISVFYKNSGFFTEAAIFAG